MALTFCPKEPDKNYVNHIDGDPTNNKILNLEWCTVKTGYNDTPVRSHFHRYSELSLIPRILFIAIT